MNLIQKEKLYMNRVDTFDSKQNKHSFYRGKDCIKKLCSDLKEQK